MPKPCQLCNAVYAKRGERYCTECRKVVLHHLRESGYLTPSPINPHVSRRTQEQRELTHETKFGTFHG